MNELNTKKLEKNIKQIIKTGQGYGKEYLPILKSTLDILKRINKKRNGGADSYFQLAQRFIGLEDHLLAQLSLQRALSLEPKHVDSLCLMVALMEEMGRVDEQLRVLEKLHQLDPGNVEVNYQIASVFFGLRDYVKSNQFALLAASQEQVSVPALLLVAESFSQLGELEHAINFLKVAFYSEPENIQIYKLFGEVYRKALNYPRAIDLYSQGLNVEPDNFDLNAGIFTCCVDLGLDKEARKYLARLIVLKKSSEQAYFYLGVYYASIGRQDKEERYYKKSLELKPGMPTVQTNLAFLYQKQERVEEAISIYEQILQNHPDFEQASVNVAMIYMGQGKLKEAFQHYHNRVASQKIRYQQLNWSGESLSGKKVLVRKEQGLGDQIESAWYLKLLEKDKVDVTFQVDKRLIPLLSRTYPSFKFSSFDSEFINTVDLSQFDYQILQRSLGLLYWPKIKEAADKREVVRFIEADKSLKKQWGIELAKLPKRKNIGISWRSGLSLRTRNRHYLTVEAIASLFKDKEVNLINLQYDYTQEEIDYLAEHLPGKFFNFSNIDLKNDQDDLAALIDSTDFVFSALTSVQCLTGALGKKSLCFAFAESKLYAGVYGKNSNPMYANSEYVWSVGKPVFESLDLIREALERNLGKS
ncbi:tetratricopeptide repeat protein [Aliikangiella sp. G2MR2-5]|uniref:tetratricopeptide repeat protein n=1 Tax=Aliikangiella sp. G2MR2-5 TaxID=2788943 RepID=UPI0018A93B2F|nr:tetratricopeptide repeat protein [Aliikangiella sp. G2MR2-5]